MGWFWKKTSAKHGQLAELAEVNQKLAHHRRQLNKLNVSRRVSTERAFLHRELICRYLSAKYRLEADLKIINSG